MGRRVRGGGEGSDAMVLKRVENKQLTEEGGWRCRRDIAKGKLDNRLNLEGVASGQARDDAKILRLDTGRLVVPLREGGTKGGTNSEQKMISSVWGI